MTVSDADVEAQVLAWFERALDQPAPARAAWLAAQALPAAGVADPMPEPDAQALARAAELMNRAERPLLLLGGGTSSPEASEAVLAFMEARRIPAVMSLRGLGAIPHGHELAVGMLGMHGARASNLLVEECDLLMVVGARLGDRATGRLDSFCPKTGIVHIDIDACEVGKLRMPQVGITADAADALNALLPLLHNNNHEPWLERVAACKAEHGLRFDRLDEVCSPYGIISHVAEILDGKGMLD